MKAKLRLIFEEMFFCKSKMSKTLNFRKSVQRRKSKQNLSIEELKSNLKILVRQAVVRDQGNKEEKHIILGKRVKHRFEVEEGGKAKKTWHTGKII